MVSNTFWNNRPVSLDIVFGIFQGIRIFFALSKTPIWRSPFIRIVAYYFIFSLTNIVLILVFYFLSHDICDKLATYAVYMLKHFHYAILLYIRGDINEKDISTKQNQKK